MLRQQVRKCNSDTNPSAIQVIERLFVPANERRDMTASLGTALLRTSGLDGQEKLTENGPTGKSVPKCTAQDRINENSFRILDHSTCSNVRT